MDAADESFVAVCAPAGYGKTALLSQWAWEATHDGGRTVAWCSLDEDDRDPRVFWGSVGNAIVSSLITSRHAADIPSPPVASLEPHAHRRLMEWIEDALLGMGDRAALIFDDAQVLEGSASEAEFIRLLRLTSRNAHIALATRSSLFDQRARLSGRVLELRADALAFTRAEAEDVLASDAIAEDTLDVVLSAADGWPAALSLARLGTERSTDTIDATLDVFDSAILHDYIQSEIFDDLGADERTALVAATICPLFSSELIDAMAGRVGVGATLPRLARTTPVIREDHIDKHGRVWYRLVPIFMGYLKEQHLALPSAELLDLASNAVGWHLESGDPLVALSLALEAGEARLVEVVMRRVGIEIIARGDASPLLSLASTGARALTSRPFGTLIVGLAAVALDDPERGRDALAAAKPMGLNADELFEWDWLRYVLSLGIAYAFHEPIDDLSAGWPEATVDELPNSLRGAVHLARGLARSRLGEGNTAREAFEVSRAIAANAGDVHSQVMSLIGLAATALEQSDIAETVRLAEGAAALALDTAPREDGRALSTAHCLIAWGRFEMLDLTEARKHASLSTHFANTQPLEHVTLQARHVSHVVHFDSLAEKRHVAEEFVASWPPDYLTAAPASLVLPSLYSGLYMARVSREPGWSAKMLAGGRHLIGDGPDLRTATALLLYSTGRLRPADSLLAALAEDTTLTPLRSSEIVGWSLRSALEFEAGNHFKAHTSMLRALELADQRMQYLEVLQPGPAIISQILTEGMHRFGAFDGVAERVLGVIQNGRRMDVGHLTIKERELLAELRTLRTVGEISRDMLLSVNTVKTHMRGIYRKLNVSTRRAAVAEAERLGLL